MIYERKGRHEWEEFAKEEKGMAHGRKRVWTNFIISLWYGRCKCMRLDILFWIYCCSCFHFFVNWMYWYLGFHFFVKWIYCFLQFLCLWTEYMIASCDFFACESLLPAISLLMKWVHNCYLWFLCLWTEFILLPMISLWLDCIFPVLSFHYTMNIDFLRFHYLLPTIL